MKLHAFKSLWEWSGDWHGRLEQVAEAGFVGVEYTLPATLDAQRDFRRQLDGHALAFIAQVVTRGPDHFGSLRTQVLNAAELGPVLINAHSATDRMPFAEQLRFFEAALALEQQIGIPIAHETHRGRAFFTPWHTAALLRQLPQLNVGADFSHWCCACEAMPSLKDDDVLLAMDRSIHIHARVGHEEGPQVSDPRAPEFAAHLALFIDLWLSICERRAAEGYTVMTFTPEFGPAPYMPALPFTNMPLADVWEVNLWMYTTFAAHFARRFG